MTQHVLAAGDSQGTVTQIFMGLAALVGAFTAYRVARRDSNADQLKEALADLATSKTRVDDLEADLIDLRKYVFGVRTQFADAGIDLPPPPVLRSGGGGQ